MPPCQSGLSSYPRELIVVVLLQVVAVEEQVVAGLQVEALLDFGEGADPQMDGSHKYRKHEPPEGHSHEVPGHGDVETCLRHSIMPVDSPPAIVIDVWC